MRKIMEYFDQIDEELYSAKEYAEKYIEMKSIGNNTWADRFKEMSNDKIKAIEWLHELTICEIDKIKKVYTPPFGMKENWDKGLKMCSEKIALIKQMLLV